MSIAGAGLFLTFGFLVLAPQDEQATKWRGGACTP
jgi:hypothetical protein